MKLSVRYWDLQTNTEVGTQGNYINSFRTPGYHLGPSCNIFLKLGHHDVI